MHGERRSAAIREASTGLTVSLLETVNVRIWPSGPEDIALVGDAAAVDARRTAG